MLIDSKGILSTRVDSNQISLVNIEIVWLHPPVRKPLRTVTYFFLSSTVRSLIWLKGIKASPIKPRVWWILFQIVLRVPLSHDDEYFQSTITNIMEVGDVTNRISLTHVAHMEETFFAKIVLMKNPLRLTIIIFRMPHCFFITGLTEREVVEKSKGYTGIFILINITHVVG